jgi:hypothetical protein
MSPAPRRRRNGRQIQRLLIAPGTKSPSRTREDDCLDRGVVIKIHEYALKLVVHLPVYGIEQLWPVHRYDGDTAFAFLDQQELIVFI